MIMMVEIRFLNLSFAATNNWSRHNKRITAGQKSTNDNEDSEVGNDDYDISNDGNDDYEED